MRRYAIHVDSFTSLDDLKPKERRDPEAVLAVLRRAKRFSVWDMDNVALRNTVSDLEATGRITTDSASVGFPWVAVTVNEPSVAPQGASDASR